MHFRWNFGFHLNQILISYYQKFYENRIDSIKPLHAWNEHFRLKIRCFKKLLIPSTPKNRSERDWTGPCKYEPVSKQSKIFYWFTNMHKIKKICIKKYYSEHLNIEWCNLWHTSITGSNSLSFVQLKIDSNRIKNQNFMTLKIQK